MKKKKKTKRKKKKVTFQTKLNHTTTKLPMSGLEKGDETLGGTRKVIEIAYFSLVVICCAVLVFFSIFRFYVMLSPHAPTQLTSLMLDKGKDFSIGRVSSKSNYTFLCPNPINIAPLRSEIEQSCDDSEDIFKNTIDQMVVRKLTQEYLDELSRDLNGKDVYIDNIYVLTSPLEGPYRSSPIAIKEKALRQWTGVDFHAFIVLTSSNNSIQTGSNKSIIQSHWALDKNGSGLYVSWIPDTNSLPFYTVIPFFGNVLRSEPVSNPCLGWIADCYLTTSLTGYPMENLTVFLKNELNRPYSLLFDNCQSFSKRLFVEVIKENIWDPLPPLYFLFDGSVEYYITLAVEVSIFINNIVVSTCCKNNEKLVTYVCLGYAFWLISLGFSKIFMAPIGLIPSYFGWIFLRVIFLLKVYHCFRLFLRLKLKERLILFLMMMVFVVLS